MTHDELLIETGRRLQVALYNGDIPAIHALRAVVELHQPNGYHHANVCDVCDAIYPCQTIQQIIENLK